MKKLLFATVVSVLVTLSACQNNPGSGDAITLKFNLPKGSDYDYNVTMDMAMNGSANGQPINMKNNMRMGYRFGVKADSAGWKRLSANISRFAMDMNAGGLNVNFDSDRAPDTSNVVNGTLGKVINALKGGEFSFTMNEKGEIGEVTGIREMMQRAMTSETDQNSAAMLSGMSSTFSDENFKQNIQQSFGMYPGKPVKPGDTWTSTLTMDNEGMPMKMDNTYTLESVNGNSAIVNMNSKISAPEPGGSVTVGGTASGKMNFDIPTGVPIDGNIKMNMTMSMNSVPMHMDINIKITGKKTNGM